MSPKDSKSGQEFDDTSLLGGRAVVSGASVGPAAATARRRRKRAAWSTVALAVFAAWLTLWTQTHPYLKHTTQKTLPAVLPSLQKGEHWTRAFFYSLGNWPRHPFGQPVVHALPYELGPPVQFPGRLIARWDAPEISVTLEGPKTPENLRESSGRVLARDSVRGCFTGSPWSTSCLKVRYSVLQRHFAEINALLGRPEYELAWIDVDNPGLPGPDRPQGLWITAQTPQRTHERFVAVTWLGTHQTFQLDHQGGEKGAQAHRLFEESIRSLKITDQLDGLKAWSERDLLEVHMQELAKLTWESNEFFVKATDAQSVLLSRITVEPKDYDAYFHLAGTSSLIIRHALRIGAPELAAAAQKTLQSAMLYAKDVRPKDPRNFQLERLWDVLKKNGK